MTVKIYAQVGSSFQIIGGKKPIGFIEMIQLRPEDGDYIALKDGSWIEDVSLIASDVRKERDLLIDRTSREINRLEDAKQDASAWRAYRIDLRNLPEQDGFPLNVNWPSSPGQFSGN